MKLGGCEVIIKCDNKAMREINPVASDDKHKSCYIASQPGKVSVEIRFVDAPLANLTGFASR